VIGYQNDWVTLAPELGLNYTYYKQDSLKESGDPNLSLKVDSEDAQAIIVSAGVDARFASLSQTNSIYPMAFVRYEFDAYADKNNDHEVKAALVAHPEYKQTFVGQNRGEHAVTGGLALGSDLTSALQIRGGLRYTEHSHGDEWGAGLNMQYLW
jgi:outer membrane autotransporter protein